MTRTCLEIAVVGAGTAGTAAALFAARGGHRVMLLECVAEPGRALGWLRDAFMPLASRVGWVRRRMCGSMAGNLRGILGRPMSVAELTGADDATCPPALRSGT